MNNSNKIIVVYKSKYGSAKRYAEWIAEEVHADLFECSKVSLSDLLKYDTIVFGGALYAVGIIGFAIIKNNFRQLKDKNVIVFSVGASPPRKEALNDIINNNFTEEMKKKVSFFHLRGGFNYSKLNIVDKLLMTLLRIKIKMQKAEELDEDSKGLLACYDHPADWTNKKAIVPIVECISNQEKRIDGQNGNLLV
jgi:menaquinone-dependent protoporphyrinogen IX oxidase